jgi:ribosomal protein S18 acetylase RimI-like enzyme
MADIGHIEIRLLRPGEERFWAVCGAPPGEVDELVKGFSEYRAAHPDDDPRCFIVATDGDRILGKLRGRVIHSELYLIDSVVVEEGLDYGAVGRSLIEYARGAFSEGAVEAMTGGKVGEAGLERLLRDVGYTVYIEKAFVERDVTGYRSPYDDPFEYVTFAEAGRDAFVETLSSIYVGNPNRDAVEPGSDFDAMVEYAGAAFAPNAWKLAYYEGTVAGLVLPQLYPEEPDEGSLFYFGVVPALRGRGHGKVLHARGLEDLARAGAIRYFGSTDVLNEPVLRIFEAHGCKRTRLRRLFRYAGTGE